jgi:ABC-2 type transport system permease protein
VVRALRVLGRGCLMHGKMRLASFSNAVLEVVWPVFFATIAFFLFRRGGGAEALVYASLGASVMGVWSATSTAAANALQRERWHGTLELLATAPVHFALVLMPIAITLAAMGIYCMAATLLWGWLAFGIDLPLEHPLAFVVAVPAAILSIATAGFVLAVAFVRHRAAWALGNMLEFPVWLIAGFLVPLSLLPGWVRPLSWLLAPTWGVNAIREASSGGSPWPDIALCVVLAAGYTAFGVLLVERMLHRARAKAALALA